LHRYSIKDKNLKPIWNCLCKCGNSCVTRSDKLSTYSCGCLQKKAVIKNNKKKAKKNSISAKNSLLLAYKKGAKERSLKFKLNFKTFIMLTSQNCTYCGIEPKQVQKAAGGNYIYNGIDRKDPNIGYTTDNCTPCCKICNRAKLDMSFEDFQKYLLRIKSNGLMKKFFLLRHEDVHNNSGVGIVAVGVQLPSGKCVMEWLSKEVTETIFESAEQITRLHSHGGLTELIWGDPPCAHEHVKKPLERRRKMTNAKIKKKKLKEKLKRDKHGMRLSLPSNKRHKSKKDYKRNNKVKVHEVEKD
jgi:hypothetical protein